MATGSERHGSVETDAHGSARSSALSSARASTVPSAATSPRGRPLVPWGAGPDPRDAPEPRGIFTSDAYQPLHRGYMHLIPRCVELYHEHIYPIMPLVFMPELRRVIAWAMEPPEANLVYALCALTALHMAGRSLAVPGQPPWEEVGRFFLDECVSVRRRYDFPEDTSLYAVISSFWLSTSFFEINQSRKSWFYLREALTLAIDLRLHDDRSYAGLAAGEVLCRQRVFWILFVTERSFAILRNKPLTLRRTPRLPSTRHDYEPPEIHAGFLKLVRSYAPLDESFVAAWNDGSDPRVSATTYLGLQRLLAEPLDFLRPRRTAPAGWAGPSDESDPTAIQKADLLITQQWLRLIVWQSSFRQGLLSTAAPDQSFSFSFPLSIARDTAAVLQSLPSRAVEVHGMGIFEKIFEIGTWSVNVLGAYDSGSARCSHPFGRAADRTARMDFLGGELALFGPSGRSGAVLDPLELFVKTLSASPNSKIMYADRLLLFAEQTPGGIRTNLSPVLPAPGRAAPGLWSTRGREVIEGSDAASVTGLGITHQGQPLGTARMVGGLGLAVDGGLGLAVDGGTSYEVGMHVMTRRTSEYTIPDGPESAAAPAGISSLNTPGGNYALSSEPTSGPVGLKSSGVEDTCGNSIGSEWNQAPGSAGIA